MVRVAWDEAKSLANRRKHGVSFEEAAKLLASSSDYLEIYDEAHSDFEDRFIAIGPVEGGLILVVWTFSDDDAVRIISARWAAAREQDLYYTYMDERR
jgi:uncharacterized protein